MSSVFWLAALVGVFGLTLDTLRRFSVSKKRWSVSTLIKQLIFLPAIYLLFLFVVFSFVLPAFVRPISQ